MGNGYTRQSAADIQDGVIVEATPLNAEFNQLQSAFNSSTGHTHDGTLGEGPKISLTGSITGVLPVVNGGIGGINNPGVAADPGASDDSTTGYVPGSIWVNSTTKVIWLCTVNTAGSAVWVNYQPIKAGLTSIGNLTTGADLMIYTTANNLYTTTALTPYARTIIDDADATSVKNTLGISTFVQTILDDTDAATVRNTIGLGSIATQNTNALNVTGGTLTGVNVTGTLSSSSVTISGGTITGITDLAVADGGTGSSSVAAMKTSFGLDQLDNTTDMNKPLSTAQKTYIDNAFAVQAPVGMVAMFPAATAPSGWVECNGALLNRTSYSALWVAAQAMGTVTDANWTSSQIGCFSVGNGSTTFRIPDLRGEFIRGWDNGKGLDPSRVRGSYQSPQNLSHAHTASADAQGNHAHGVSDPGHAHTLTMWAGDGGRSDGFGGNGTASVIGNFATAAAGTGIGIQAAGLHGHNITVNADGGSEARPGNVSLMYCIKYQ
jgi:microcystin-dependent protein